MEPLKASDPHRIGGYELIGRLGAGGMGQVYIGLAPTTGPVALKIILPEYAHDNDFRARFRREVAAAKLVKGPYIAEVIDADIYAEPAWMATQYVVGSSLAKVVSEVGALPSRTVRALAAGTAEALVSIGRVGLIHRDLKPANVVLGAKGPRVIDFGIAKAADASGLTRAGDIVGTAGYMAPEQIDNKPLTAAADVFSLGAVLAYALTGTGPYGQGAFQAVMARVLFHEPDLTRVPSDWVDIIRQCLSKDPAARPTLTALLDRFVPAGRSVASLFEGDWLPDKANSFVEQQTMTAQRQQAEFQRGRAAVSHPPAPTASGAYPSRGYPSQWSSGPVTNSAIRERRRRRWPLAAGLAVLAVLAVVGTSSLVVRLLPDNQGEEPGGLSPSANVVETLPSPEVRTSEPAPPPDALPVAYINTWAGDIHQSDVGRTYPVSFTLKAGRIGSVVGTVRYWTLQCAGELMLDEVTDTDIKVTERITEGQSNCETTVPLTFALQTDGSMRYDGRGERYPAGALTGTVTKSFQVLPESFVGTWRGTVHQYNIDQDYEVVIVIKDRAIGSTGSIDYPPLQCGGTLTLQHIRGNTAWFTENITRNERSPGCIVTGTVALGQIRKGGSIFRYFENPENTAEQALVQGPVTRE